VHPYLLKKIHRYLLKIVHSNLLKTIHCYLRKNVHCKLPFTIGFANELKGQLATINIVHLAISASIEAHCN